MIKRFRNYGLNSQATCMSHILWTRTLLQTASGKITFVLTLPIKTSSTIRVSIVNEIQSIVRMKSWTSLRQCMVSYNLIRWHEFSCNLTGGFRMLIYWYAAVFELLLHSKTADNSVVSRVYVTRKERRMLYYFVTSFFFSYKQGVLLLRW